MDDKKLTKEEENLLKKLSDDSNNDTREFFDSLSLHEREVALQIIKEMESTGKSDTYDLLWETDFVRKPATPKEFLEDHAYLGKDITSKLYDPWKEVLCTALDAKNEINELVLSGAIGIGKSTVANVAMMYKLYSLSCLKNPQKYYHKMEHITITFALFSATLQVISNTTFSDLLGMFNASPYFNEFYNSKDAKKIVLQDKRVDVKLGSQELHEQGLHVFACVLDETNYMRQAGEYQRAFNIYSQLMSRMKSRFMYKGKIPGLLCLVSSSKSTADYIDDHISKVKNNKNALVKSFPIWVVRGFKKGVSSEVYCGDTFKVDSGDQFHSPKIITEDSPSVSGEENVIEIPVEYHSEFERDIYTALRDVAGRSSQPNNPLIPNKLLIAACRDITRKHPFSVESAIIDMSDESKTIQDYFLVDELFVREFGNYRLKVNPSTFRYAHIDIGLRGPSNDGDPAAMSVGHYAGTKSVIRYLPDGRPYSIPAVQIYIDFMIQMKPQKGSKLDISKILEFIFFLENMGMNFARVTYDTFQSESSLQTLQKLKIESGILSTVRDDHAYLELRSCYTEQRISVYEYPLYEEELARLEHTPAKKKVDHPPRGSKDITDTVAGVVENIIMHENTSITEREIIDSEEMLKLQDLQNRRDNEDMFILNDYERNLGEFDDREMTDLI